MQRTLERGNINMAAIGSGECGVGELDTTSSGDTDGDMLSAWLYICYYLYLNHLQYFSIWLQLVLLQQEKASLSLFYLSRLVILVSHVKGSKPMVSVDLKRHIDEKCVLIESIHVHTGKRGRKRGVRVRARRRRSPFPTHPHTPTHTPRPAPSPAQKHSVWDGFKLSESDCD